MSGRGIPFGLLLATAGAMAWLLSHPVTVRAAPAPQYRVQCPKSLPADTTPPRPRRQLDHVGAGRVYCGWGGDAAWYA